MGPDSNITILEFRQSDSDPKSIQVVLLQDGTKDPQIKYGPRILYKSHQTKKIAGSSTSFWRATDNPEIEEIPFAILEKQDVLPDKITFNKDGESESMRLSKWLKSPTSSVWPATFTARGAEYTWSMEYTSARVTLTSSEINAPIARFQGPTPSRSPTQYSSSSSSSTLVSSNNPQLILSSPVTDTSIPMEEIILSALILYQTHLQSFWSKLQAEGQPSSSGRYMTNHGAFGAGMALSA
ncbi:hypothetical protein VKT23_018762 [Stygiomarasmius scandens]|uniref:DUF6593 domain-containing protein n=1 Tax=Marasmiellus scandens TaxID=2682957 RepID=A0ABR1IR94_9AGAR